MAEFPSPEGLSDPLIESLAATARPQGWRAATRTALRSRSRATRHVITRNATRGALDHAGVLALARGGGGPWTPSSIAGWDRKWTEALAWVVGLQRLDPDDELVGARLFALIHAEFGLSALTERGRFIYLQLLVLAGETERARAVLAELGDAPDPLSVYPRADLANPFTADPHAPGAAAADWLVVLNARLTELGSEPIALADAGPTPFDRLRADAPAGSRSGPLVSVVMTSYRPDHCLVTAVRSVLTQTWADLEVLLVDDASPAEFDAVLQECAALDDRVRLVRQSVNGGTYLARNAALELARGEFVVNQDSDDWSHPRRLERQLEPMLADPAVVATRGTSLRCDERLRFRLPGWDPAWAAVSTLMFRRAFVAEHVGYWDRVRKSADSEFLDRLRLAADRVGCSVVDVEPPLLFARLVDSGLSRSELMFGWEHEARRDYRMMFEHWHRRLRATGAPTHLAAEPAARPFLAPSRFTRGVPDEVPPRLTYDVVLAGDWRHGGDAVPAVLDRLRDLRAQGRTVGLLQVDGFERLDRERPPMAEPVLDAVAAGEAAWVHLDEGARAGVVEVQEPTSWAFVPSTPVDLDVGELMPISPRARAPRPRRAPWLPRRHRPS